MTHAALLPPTSGPADLTHKALKNLANMNDHDRGERPAAMAKANKYGYK
jgi:hypothetical protein